MDTANWPAAHQDMRDPSSLKPHPRNSRLHTPEQVTQVANSMREWGFTMPVLVTEDGTIIAGHCRVLAAKELGLTEVPTITAHGWSEEQVRGYIIADNRLTELGTWAPDVLREEAIYLSEADFNVNLLGFADDDLGTLMAEEPLPEVHDRSTLFPHGRDRTGHFQSTDHEAASAKYTGKVETPIYEMKGENPELEELFDTTKTDALMADIAKAKVPEDVRSFLTHAAQRHTAFRFDRIAEYYAHAPAHVQDLMERSALVIVDFDKAIEQGFVKLSKAIGDQYYEDRVAGAEEAEG